MIEKHDVPISKISWLSSSYPSDAKGVIKNFYEPETVTELVDVCSRLYASCSEFDLIGHTSNIYFVPNYSVENMVTTRKLRKYAVLDNEIYCECGVSVSSFARDMVNNGVCGFEGLVDLPGTVGASIYGNATCYNCGISYVLKSIECLLPDGSIRVLKASELGFTHRSSIFKRQEIQGVIISAVLNKKIGDAEQIKNLAEMYRKKRQNDQCGPLNNLGSIHSDKGKRTLWLSFCDLLSKILYIKGRQEKKLKMVLRMNGVEELAPYMSGWNRFVWKDEKGHTLFWKYLEVYDKLFKNNKVEIVIKK